MKYLYHKEHGTKRFQDDESHEGWHDTPAAFGVITCPSQEQLAEMAARIHPTEESIMRSADALAGALGSIVTAELAGMSKEELLAFAEQRGIEVDKRLGVEKLRAVLNGDGT